MAYKRNNKYGKNNYRKYENRDRNKKVANIFNPKSKRASHVTVISHPNEDPMRTIKRFLKKCKKERIVEQVRERQYFIKPSKKRRLEEKSRKRTIQRLHLEQEKQFS
jgi:ribosomal protein S21